MKKPFLIVASIVLGILWGSIFFLYLDWLLGVIQK